MRALLAVVLLTLGCGSSDGETTNQREQARPYVLISVTADKTELVPGETAKLQVYLMNDDGSRGDPVAGNFDSNNVEVATVEENTGVVTARAKGVTNIRAAYGPGSTYVAITVK